MRWTNLKITPRFNFTAFFVVLAISTFLSGFFFGSSVNALDFMMSAEAVNDAGGEPYCRALVTDDTTSYWSNWATGNFPTIGGNSGNGIAINSIQCKHIADDVRIEELQYVEMVVRVKTDAFHPSSQYYQNTGYFATTLTGPRFINDGWFRGVYEEQIGVEENYNERFEYWRLVSRYSEHGWVNYVESPFRFYNNSVQSPMQIRVLSWTIWKPRDVLTTDDKQFLTDLLSANSSSALLSQIKDQEQATTNAVNGLRSDVRAQTQQQHDDYENEVQREEDKQEELEDASDDLSLSAQSTGNPFAQFFTSATCVTLTNISAWFNVSPAIQVCSPYPQNIRPILTFVTSVAVTGLLIRLYYKHLNGGYTS